MTTTTKLTANLTCLDCHHQWHEDLCCYCFTTVLDGPGDGGCVCGMHMTVCPQCIYGQLVHTPPPTRIINLTPHVLNIEDSAGNMVDIPPSGEVARCTQTEEVLGTITLGNTTGIKLTRQTFGEVYGLPEATPDTFLVVSRLVKAAVPHRDDVVCPGPLIRDSEGRPKGCRGLSL